MYKDKSKITKVIVVANNFWFSGKNAWKMNLAKITPARITSCPTSRPILKENKGKRIEDSCPNMDFRRYENPSPWIQPNAAAVMYLHLNTVLSFCISIRFQTQEIKIVKAIQISTMTCGILMRSLTLKARVKECPSVNAVTNQSKFFHCFRSNRILSAMIYKMWS